MSGFEHGARRGLRQAAIGHDDAVVQGTEIGGRAARERLDRRAAQVGGRVVDLQVSKLGKGLAKTLQPVCAWGSENMEEIGAIASARAVRSA